MKFRFSQRLPLFAHGTIVNRQRLRPNLFFLRKLHTTTKQAGASINGGGSSSDSKGNPFLVPGATVATILMLGALHARRMYSDKKIVEARESGIELEIQPDVKAKFLSMLPLRSISRFWGSVSSTELPVWLRPYAHRAWARAFHSNLEEAALPLDQYASLKDFFVRTLKEGSRPIDSDPRSLISPVDGTVIRVGELKEGVLIEQVKGFSYSVSSLLGAGSFLPLMAASDIQEDISCQENNLRDESRKSWWRISLASPKLRESSSSRPMKGLFYCVIYLRPGDYHRIHSPVDWNVLLRRHFSGRLYPVNERATRTIKNLYVENERVVLEGRWQEGYIAMAAIGATNIGSIELFIEPALKTNQPRKKLLQSEAPEERVYEPEGTGVMLKKGDEVAVFNMGSTVVLVFQAPALKKQEDEASSSEFKFCVERGDKIRMGEALGRWHDL
ncbi:phosphatidylserine decarboxylase proenzyme 1, mitochondrial isoform X2 [Cynara cardunculus var. scolymus]|uniref:Phosphatidylserine decarboxylase proenzyme 1, mitochondrial n=1 Tax=Cynara cardunculus var. scolymus TaxID=59895 RepID=A0A103XFI1_CYNCS|nr:phosphatidylserine decarboxylase proenzyme 1, mitochondrial isoform X2 [Cynara cardunculus var. scolymus]KVH89781.1 Phosphatidylserine decarboxylase [Cynara cardunculus var. scolymus]